MNIKDKLEIPKSPRKGRKKSDGNLEINLRRSARDKKRPDFYSASLVQTKCIYVNVVRTDSPSSYEEVLKRNDYDLWKVAMNKEIDSLSKKNLGTCRKTEKR